jgi:uncharacterized protein YecE (DUF72 family)
MTARIRVGTASWIDHEPFYPAEYAKASMKSQRIRYYARYFSLVEVDSTFYTLQPARNFQLWADRTPDDFTFDVKAFGELTWHHRDDAGAPITPSAETFEKFGAMLRPLRAAHKLGAVLFQFPPWFRASENNEEYLTGLPGMLPDVTLVVEFRHRSWLEGAQLERTRNLLRETGLAYCVVDEPQIGSGSAPPVVMITNDQFAMARFHGRNTHAWYARDLPSSRDRFDYRYAPAELAPWAERVARMASALSGSEVHVVMNNNARNYAIVNALEFQELLGQEVGQEVGQGVPLPDGVDPAPR